MFASAGVPLHRSTVRAGEVLARVGDPLDRIYVPLCSIVIMARQTPLDPVPLTVGMMGYEGLVGWPALLLIPQWSHNAIALRGGEMASVSAADAIAACRTHAALNSLLLRVAHNHALQLAQSVVANLGHSLERRLARWLLMIDDRTAAGAIHITHEQLARLLNVRRATVTGALHQIEGEGLIASRRGRVEVRDRGALEARAGQSYGLSEHDYTANIEPFGKRAVVA